jgi:hypothetical protein
MMPLSMPTEHSASEILARVAETYASCRSYRDDGEEQTVFITGTMPWHRNTTRKRFRTAFVRPERLFFEYREVGIGPESEWHRGVAWTDASGPHAWNSLGINVVKIDSIDSAVGSLAGLSNSASSFAAKLLLPGIGGPSYLPDPVTARLIGDEIVDGVPCHRIEGQRFSNQPVTIWVECQSFLVRRVASGMEFSEETLRRQEQQLRDYIAKMPANAPSRARLEKGAAMRAEHPTTAFRAEATMLRRAAINVEIDESVFAFTPPI